MVIDTAINGAADMIATFNSGDMRVGAERFGIAVQTPGSHFTETTAMTTFPLRLTEGTECARHRPGGQGRCQPQPIYRDPAGHPCRRPGRSRMLFRRPSRSGHAGDGTRHSGTRWKAAAASAGRSAGRGLKTTAAPDNRFAADFVRCDTAGARRHHAGPSPASRRSAAISAATSDSLPHVASSSLT